MELLKFLKDACDCFIGHRGENSSNASLPAVISSDSPERRFDNAARSSANALTRRDALSTMLSGIAGVILSQFGFKTAWAALCLCGSATYDTFTQCCVGGTTLVPKFPVRNKAACPNRVQHAGACDPNGCGAKGGPSFPGRFGRANFRLCCNAHDCCYSVCDADKRGCDSALLSCLNSQCSNNFPSPVLTGLCLVAAGVYFDAVALKGGSAYDKTQQVACDCCGTQTCGGGPLGFSCAFPGVCGGYLRCGSGSSCFCGRTTEGVGVCFEDASCPDVQKCTSSASCPAGFVCVAGGCCGGSVCARPCGFTGLAASAAAPAATNAPRKPTIAGR